MKKSIVLALIALLVLSNSAICRPLVPAELERTFPRQAFHDPGWFQQRYIYNEQLDNNNYDLEGYYDAMRDGRFTITTFLVKEPTNDLYHDLEVWVSSDFTDWSTGDPVLYENMGPAWDYCLSGGHEFASVGSFWPALHNSDQWYYNDAGAGNPDNIYVTGNNGSVGQTAYPGGAGNPNLFYCKVATHNATTENDPLLALLWSGVFQHFSKADSYYVAIEIAHNVSDNDLENSPNTILFSVDMGDFFVPVQAFENGDDDVFGMHDNRLLDDYLLENPPGPARDEIEWTGNEWDVTYGNLWDGTFEETGETHNRNDGFRTQIIGPFALEGGFRNPIGVKIWWHDNADFYLKSIKFYDSHYQRLVVEESEDAELEIAQGFWDAYYSVDRDVCEFVTGYYIDEPPFYFGKAYRKVLDICKEWLAFDGAPVIMNGASGYTVGPIEPAEIAANWTWNNLKLRIGQRVGDYARRDSCFGLDTLIYNIYTIGPQFEEASCPSAASYAASIQAAFDALIDSDPNQGTGLNSGLYGAARVAKWAGNAPWWMTIQCHEELAWNEDTDSWNLNFRDPTPNEIKAEAYLSLCYGAKGLSYFILPSTYNWALQIRHELSIAPDNAPDEGSGSMADYRGLMDLVNPQNGEFWSEADFLDDDAFENGVLVTNDKFDAVQEVNQHLDEIGNCLIGLIWEDATCVATADVHRRASSLDWESDGTITVTQVYDPYTVENDDANNWYVEIGTFHDKNDDNQRYFMVVNRRCEEYPGLQTNELRDVTIQMELEANTEKWNVQEVGGAYAYSDMDDPEFTIILEPGEGKLYRLYEGTDGPYINQATTWSGTVIIDQAFTVNAALTIDAGTNVIFTQGGTVTCYNSVTVNGTEANPVHFHGGDGDKDGKFILYGGNVDEFKFCSFLDMQIGIKSVKPSGSLSATNCSFIACEYEGINVTTGSVTVRNCYFGDNKTDGAYFYNCTASIDSSMFEKNKGNGLKLDYISSSSTVSECEFLYNGDKYSSNPCSGLFVYNCSPFFNHCKVTENKKYGISGLMAHTRTWVTIR